MDFVVVFIAGAAAAASALLIGYWASIMILARGLRSLSGRDEQIRLDRSKVAEQGKALDLRSRSLDEEIKSARERNREDIQTASERADEEIRSAREQAQNEIRTARERAQAEIKNAREQAQKDLDHRRQQFEKDIQRTRTEWNQNVAALEARKVQYDGLVRENSGLKEDLFHRSVQIKKMERDHAAITHRQEELTQRTNELAQRYLDENVSWISGKLNANNFATRKNELLKVIERCRGIGFEIPEEREKALVDDLKAGFERAVREQFQREEQARIRAQIREEEKLAREVEKQIQDAQREEQALRLALERALEEAEGKHSAEVERLETKLKEAEEKAQRAKSRAQMTRSGYVYVLSNIGSFGEGVFKVGMTRRLEPLDRVRELGDASVPFPFDVHMMVSCDDAPSLENALHRELHKSRLNRVNLRKEFFRVDLDSLRQIAERHHGQVDFMIDPPAAQYRDSLVMTEEDYAFVEKTIESVFDEEDGSLSENNSGAT